MFAKGVYQRIMSWLIRRFRGQARSHIWTEYGTYKPVGYKAAALLILILGAPSNTLAERRLESVGNPL